MTVAYAALTTNLKIAGTAEVNPVRWDIHFADWSEPSITGTASQDTAAEQTALDAPVTKIAGLKVILNKPGDSITYNFKIVNDGTINATRATYSQSLLVSTEGETTANTPVTAATPGELTQDVISYTVECTDEGDTELAKTSGEATCSLTVTYNQPNGTSGAGAQTSQTAGENQVYSSAKKTVTIGAEWFYVQAN